MTAPTKKQIAAVVAGNALEFYDFVTYSFFAVQIGRSLFPGSGFLDEVGEGAAAGSVLNVPLEPWTGAGPWIDAVRAIVPGVAAAFGPDVVVSQHGCDTHAWDPLAHLRVTTTAMGTAARLVDSLAHRWAGGRWLATGGGGYDVYRVVPRAWSQVWLAANHAPVPDAIPATWREQWAADAGRYDQAPIPATFDDPPNAGLPYRAADEAADARALRIAEQVLDLVLGHLRVP